MPNRFSAALREALGGLPKFLAMAAIGSAVAWFGYPPFGFWPLAIVGPALLWAAAARKSPLSATALGLGYGLGFHFALIYWIVNTIADYGGLHPILAITAYVLLVCYLALYPALCARAVSHVAAKSPTAAVAFAPFAWTGLEWMRARFMSGFGWGDMAQALWKQGWALDLAPRVGAVGAGLFAALVGSAVMWGFLHLKGGERPPRRALLPALAGVILVALVPFLPSGLSDVTETRRVALVQGNIDQAVKWAPEFREETVGIHRRLTFEAVKELGGADLVIWPETAFPYYWQERSKLRETVEKTAEEAKAPIVFGSPAFDRAEGRKLHRNSVYAVDAAGRTVGRYDKMHLVPFGEYVPAPKVLFFIKRMVFAAGDFTPGDRAVTLAPGNLPVGPLVCYESIYSDYAMEHAESGARMLALVTNDAWFGLTSAPWQHLAYAAWRAAETGLPVARAANTGVSAFFDRRGRLVKYGPQAVEATLTATVECPLPAVPLARTVEPLVGPGCLLLALAGFFAILRLPKARRETGGE